MKFLSSVAALFLTSFALANATILPASRSSGISAEFLYMSTGIADAYFADSIILPTQAYVGTQFLDKPKWHCGVRIESIYSLSNLYSRLRLRGTYFPQFTNSRRVEGILKTAWGNFPRAASIISVDQTYHFGSLDLLYEHDIFFDYPFNLAIQAGLHYAYLYFKGTYAALLFGPNEFVPNDTLSISKKQGIGPEIALVLAYSLCQPLSLQVRLATAMLLARSSNMWKETSSLNVPGGDLKNEPYWKDFYTSNVRVGIHYDICRKINLETGYELMCYKDAVEQYFTFDIKEFFADFTAHGLFAQLGISF